MGRRSSFGVPSQKGNSATMSIVCLANVHQFAQDAGFFGSLVPIFAIVKCGAVAMERWFLVP